jgi:N-acetylglucosamine kinase-like BadF-type ATPase
MFFIIDSGSTKCDWLALDDNGKQLFDKQRTKGMNPAILTKEKLYDIIKENKIIYQYRNEATHIFFYGAGCGTKKPRLMLKGVLEDFFQKAKVDVKEDTYAAVYATVGITHKPAVVCILGTGSNCSYYDGENLHQRVISLGYTLMDDASGNYYGKQLIRDYYYNHMPHNIRVSFEEKYNLESDFIKFNLYKEPNPNAYLANFAEFIFLNKETDYMNKLIKDGIRLFARNMIFQYEEELKTVPVHFAGSIAFFGQQEIREVGEEMGFKVGVFERRPIEGLVKYHTHNLQVLK